MKSNRFRQFLKASPIHEMAMGKGSTNPLHVSQAMANVLSLVKGDHVRGRLLQALQGSALYEASKARDRFAAEVQKVAEANGLKVNLSGLKGVHPHYVFSQEAHQKHPELAQAVQLYLKSKGYSGNPQSYGEEIDDLWSKEFEPKHLRFYMRNGKEAVVSIPEINKRLEANGLEPFSFFDYIEDIESGTDLPEDDYTNDPYGKHGIDLSGAKMAEKDGHQEFSFTGWWPPTHPDDFARAAKAGVNRFSQRAGEDGGLESMVGPDAAGKFGRHERDLGDTKSGAAGAWGVENKMARSIDAPVAMGQNGSEILPPLILKGLTDVGMSCPPGVAQWIQEDPAGQALGTVEPAGKGFVIKFAPDAAQTVLDNIFGAGEGQVMGSWSWRNLHPSLREMWSKYKNSDTPYKSITNWRGQLATAINAGYQAAPDKRQALKMISYALKGADGGLNQEVYKNLLGIQGTDEKEFTPALAAALKGRGYQWLGHEGPDDPEIAPGRGRTLALGSDKIRVMNKDGKLIAYIPKSDVEAQSDEYWGDGNDSSEFGWSASGPGPKPRQVPGRGRNPMISNDRYQDTLTGLMSGQSGEPKSVSNPNDISSVVAAAKIAYNKLTSGNMNVEMWQDGKPNSVGITKQMVDRELDGMEGLIQLGLQGIKEIGNSRAFSYGSFDKFDPAKENEIEERGEQGETRDLMGKEVPIRGRGIHVMIRRLAGIKDPQEQEQWVQRLRKIRQMGEMPQADDPSRKDTYVTPEVLEAFHKNSFEGRKALLWGYIVNQAKQALTQSTIQSGGRTRNQSGTGSEGEDINTLANVSDDGIQSVDRVSGVSADDALSGLAGKEGSRFRVGDFESDMQKVLGDKPTAQKRNQGVITDGYLKGYENAKKTYLDDAAASIVAKSNGIRQLVQRLEKSDPHSALGAIDAFVDWAKSARDTTDDLEVFNYELESAARGLGNMEQKLAGELQIDPIVAQELTGETPDPGTLSMPEKPKNVEPSAQVASAPASGGLSALLQKRKASTATAPAPSAEVQPAKAPTAEVQPARGAMPQKSPGLGSFLKKKQESLVSFDSYRSQLRETGNVYDGTKPKDGCGFNWWGSVGKPHGTSISGEVKTMKSDPDGTKKGKSRSKR